MKESEIFFVAIAPPKGEYPLVNAFATVVISGMTPKFVGAKYSPVLPKPVITSSAIKTIPYLSHISLSLCQYSGGGI